MAHIRNVAHIPDLIAKKPEIAENNVKSDSRTGMSQMSIAVNSRATYIHAYMRGVNRFEKFFFPGQGIVNFEFVFHNLSYLFKLQN